MNERNGRVEGGRAGEMADVRAELIFFMGAQNGKSSDGRDELVVAKGLQARNGAARGSEREIQRKPKMRIARGGQVQPAGVEHKGAKPVPIKRILVANNQVETIDLRSGSGGAG